MSFDLMKLVGLDLDDTTLAFTEHPFSEGFAVGDARIATHIYEDDCISNVYSIIHEAGHTMYELGVNPAYARTCLEGGTSMGIHESQSRFFENTVGRSRAFMGPLLEVLRRHAPEVYGNVDEDTLYRAVNIAQPSLIRTEADELTYPLHIMVRYQIERMLFAGEATAKDIPALWNRFMNEYLGIPVPDDTHGCLQDTHWSGGSFGYFPTYALGSAYDAMFVPAMCRDGVDLNGAVRAAIWRPFALAGRAHLAVGPRQRRAGAHQAPAAWTLTPATTAATCRTSSPRCTSCKARQHVNAKGAPRDLSRAPPFSPSHWGRLQRRAVTRFGKTA